MTEHEVPLRNVNLLTGRGGTIKVLSYEPVIFGSENGWARLDDVYLRSNEDVLFGVRDYTTTTATIEHLDSDAVLSMNLTPVPMSAAVDMQFTGLQPDAPYRLYTGGSLAACDSGRATGQSSIDGRLRFNGVQI